MCTGGSNAFATNNSGGGVGLRTSLPQVGPSGYTNGIGPPNSITAQPGGYTPYQTPDWINAGLYAANQPITNYPVENYGRWNWQNGATNGQGMSASGWPTPSSITQPYGMPQQQPGWPSSTGYPPGVMPQQGSGAPGGVPGSGPSGGANLPPGARMPTGMDYSNPSNWGNWPGLEGKYAHTGGIGRATAPWAGMSQGQIQNTFLNADPYTQYGIAGASGPGSENLQIALGQGFGSSPGNPLGNFINTSSNQYGADQPQPLPGMPGFQSYATSGTQGWPTLKRRQ